MKTYQGKYTTYACRQRKDRKRRIQQRRRDWWAENGEIVKGNVIAAFCAGVMVAVIAWEVSR